MLAAILGLIGVTITGFSVVMLRLGRLEGEVRGHNQNLSWIMTYLLNSGKKSKERGKAPCQD